MKKIVLVIIAIAISHFSMAQDSLSVRGVIADFSDGSVLPGSTVAMINIKDSTLIKYGVTDANGIFEINKLEKAFYRISVVSLGYKPYTQVVRVSKSLDFGKITIEQDTKMLENVEVVGEAVPVEVKGDTILYNADAYKVNPDASTTDLVSKMPGIVVDGSGVTANGEKIQQVLVDGKRFFGQDPLLSLNSIPAEVVNKIEVFDQKSERSQFTGFDDGNTTKTMNVVTRENKRNGLFGKFYGGYGTDDRYSAGLSLNKFGGDQQLTVLGMTNNVNQQNFTSEELGDSGGRRRGARGGDDSAGSQSGISTTNAAGLNFSDKIGEKATFEGSYFFNDSHSSNDQESSRESFLEEGSLFYDETQESNSDNLNHRLNMRINYDINDKNKLTYIPSISYQNNESLDHTIGETTSELGDVINQTDNTYKTTSEAYNVNNSLIFQHKFDKIGRSIFFNLDSRISTTDGENYFEDVAMDSVTQYQSDQNDNSLAATVTYSEPVGNSGQISTSYKIDNSKRDSDKETYIIDPETGESVFNPILSNQFNSRYTTHLPTIMYSNRGFGKFFNVGVSYQHATLNNDQSYPEVGTFKRDFNSILPTAMGRLEFKGGANMFFRYSTSTNEPSVSQLQNVIDNTNPLFISLGNPELGQSYTHSLMMRISKTNTDKNTSLSNFTRVQQTSDYITNSTEFAAKDSVYNGGIVVQRGTQISKPVNLDGYWNVSNNTTHSIMLLKLKTNFNTSVGLGYARKPGITNDITNISNTYSGNFRFSAVSNISEKVDFNIYYNASANLVTNSIQSGSSSNSKYVTQKVGGKLNLIFWKGFVFRNDIFFENYNGISDTFNSNYVLWNMSFAKKFLKNDLGELELTVFDLLNQNQSFSQNVTPTYVEETRTEVLQQYFMLKFTYQLRKFKKS